MALSYVQYPSDGVTIQYDVPFGYLSKTHVFAFVDDELRGFKWISNTRIELLVAPSGTSSIIKFQRLTERASRVVNFTDGYTLLAGDLNSGDLQNFYIMQELIDQLTDGILAGDLTVLNPDGGWITAQWIADQIDASAPPAALAGLADLIAAEELARASAVSSEASARAAAVVAEALTRLNADDALSSSLTGVLSRTDDAEAAILANATTSADADSALAVSLAAVVSRTDTAEAAITSLDTAVANETTARGEAVDAVTASVGDNTSDIVTVNEALVSEGLTRASAVTALAASIMGSDSNRILEPLFSDAGAGWNVYSPGVKTVTEVSAHATLRVAHNITSVGEYAGVYTYYARPPVEAGERIAVQLIVGSSGPVVSARVYLQFYDAAGDFLSYSPVYSVDGAEAFPTRRQYFFDVPASAASIMVYYDAPSSGLGEVTLYVAEPMVTSASALQSTFPSFLATQVTEAKITAVSNAQISDNTARATEINVVEAGLEATTFSALHGWDFSDGDHGWASVLNDSQTVTDDGIHVVTDGTNGWRFQMPGYLNRPGNEIREIRIRMRRTDAAQEANWLGRFEYQSELGSYGVSGNTYIDTDHPQGYAQNEWFVWRMFVDPTFLSLDRVTAIRFRLYEGGGVHAAYDISHVAFGTTSFGASSARVTQISAALTDAEGEFAYWGLKLNAGDNSVASIEAMSDTKTEISKLLFKADRIEMEGDVIINGSLYTEQLALGAVSNVAADQTAAAQTYANNSWFVVAILNFTSVGIGVELRGTGEMISTGTVGGAGTVGTHQYLLQRSGAGTTTVNLVHPGVNYPQSVETSGGWTTGKTAIQADYNDLPAAGTYNYRLYCRSDNTLGTSYRSTERAYLSAKEFKR